MKELSRANKIGIMMIIIAALILCGLEVDSIGFIPALLISTPLITIGGLLQI